MDKQKPKFKKGDMLSFTFWELDKNYDSKIWNQGSQSEKTTGVVLFAFTGISEHYTVYTLHGYQRVFPKNAKQILVDIIEHKELLKGYYELLEKPGMLVE